MMVVNPHKYWHKVEMLSAWCGLHVLIKAEQRLKGTLDENA